MPTDPLRTETAAVDCDAERMLAEVATAREHRRGRRHGYDPPDQP